MDAIEPYMKANQDIPATAFCTLPEAVIKLDTQPNIVSHRRQYPLPIVLQDMLDKQLEKWLKEGTIVKAPVGTQWNSPITFAVKKDAQGNPTAKRPCLDPRHIVISEHQLYLIFIIVY